MVVHVKMVFVELKKNKIKEKAELNNISEQVQRGTVHDNYSVNQT